ncbi:MAG: threonine--tRNA ligase [Candidatus Liptonbacteria bacterium]|nr:threonine--tRNA ligase [Candidatus Liptonbacteria bacterium]
MSKQSEPNAPDIEYLSGYRHSLAHLLAAAVLEIYPGTKRTIGPAIDNGFYYDFEFSKPISDSDLAAIENKMREILPAWSVFLRQEATAAEARAAFADNPYKLELIDEFSEDGQTLTLYTSGSYLDLCRGGHVENARQIAPDSFKLDRLAGAYWRGSEKNKMLTRIYGLAFLTKAELDAYLAQREEAEKRDHKKLGQQLDLFVFSDMVGAGLPLWTPRGTLVRNLLDDFVWELRRARGYERVEIPHITKKELYEKSGHWDKFKDELFRIKTREGHEFAMKPMNCPHHCQIYARRQWSYRDLPQRYANTTMVYRDEQTGELSGLARVRSITQDDAHVFCRLPQAKEEFLKIWDIVQELYGAFGFKLRVRLSLHDPAHPEKYLGNAEKWEFAEGMLREIVIAKNTDWFEGVGEAAFYGPKLDFMGKDALDREHQVATIQLDVNMPERFGLACTNETGQPEGIVMIHAAIMGAIERFLAILIEHVAGALPLWLAPEQVRILPVSDKFMEYGGRVFLALKEAGLRAELPEASETLGKRIREAEMMKIPYVLVVGEKESAAGTVTVRPLRRSSSEASEHGASEQKTMELKELVIQLSTRSKSRK